MKLSHESENHITLLDLPGLVFKDHTDELSRENICICQNPFYYDRGSITLSVTEGTMLNTDPSLPTQAEAVLWPTLGIRLHSLVQAWAHVGGWKGFVLLGSTLL